MVYKKSSPRWTHSLSKNKGSPLTHNTAHTIETIMLCTCYCAFLRIITIIAPSNHIPITYIKTIKEIKKQIHLGRSHIYTWTLFARPDLLTRIKCDTFMYAYVSLPRRRATRDAWWARTGMCDRACVRRVTVAEECRARMRLCSRISDAIIYASSCAHALHLLPLHIRAHIIIAALFVYGVRASLAHLRISQLLRI